MGVQRISYAFRFSDSTITVHVFDTINVPGISSCMFNKEECPYPYVDFTSAVDRSFVDQTELSFHGRRFSKTSSKFISVVPSLQELFVFAELRLFCVAAATMLRVSCPYILIRHTLYDVSNRSCFITLTLRVRYIMTTDPESTQRSTYTQWHHLVHHVTVANERIRPNDGHAIAKSRRSSMWDHCVPTNMASSWGGKHTRCIFFNHNAICERF